MRSATSSSAVFTTSSGFEESPPAMRRPRVTLLDLSAWHARSCGHDIAFLGLGLGLGLDLGLGLGLGLRLRLGLGPHDF